MNRNEKIVMGVTFITTFVIMKWHTYLTVKELKHRKKMLEEARLRLGLIQWVSENYHDMEPSEFFKEYIERSKFINIVTSQ